MGGLNEKNGFYNFGISRKKEWNSKKALENETIFLQQGECVTSTNRNPIALLFYIYNEKVCRRETKSNQI